MPEFGAAAVEAHVATHQNGGADELIVTGLSGELADTQPSTWAKVASKPSTFDPTDHALDHENGGGDELSLTGLSGVLADAQDAKAHAPSHKDGAADELDASELAGALGTNGQYLKTDGAAASWETAVLSSFYNAYVCVWDKKTQGTHGGTFSSGGWWTRDINYEQADTANICIIASNQITLPAGTYRCLVRAPSRAVSTNQVRLYDTTGSAVLVLGSCVHGDTTYAQTISSFAAGLFTLVSESVLEVQHRCSSTKSDNGYGLACNWAEEVYTVAEFWRLS